MASHDKICNKLSEIQWLESENLPQKLADIYFEISNHTSAVRVKFRNILNIDERLNLDAALGAIESYRNPKHFISTDKARTLIDIQQTGDLEDIEKLRDSFSLNKAEFEDLKDQVADLLNEIDNKNLETEKLNHRINELEAPITWKLAPNHASRAGNTIIAVAQSMNMHLDRSHYTGDVYSADLFFFTDRIKPTQTIDTKALNESGERIAQLAHLVEPVHFTYDLDSRLVVAHAVMQHKESEKRVDPITKVRQFLQTSDSLISFIRDSFHVGLWGETGTGKTTAISNIIGGMVKELGGKPIIRLTIPKIDASTQKIFPEVHHLGINESVFGLLEAALEIQYRIWKNEQAFKAKEMIQDYSPILFFIDEINLIFTRWRSINDTDLENILSKFEATLSGERLTYFTETMRIELANYKGQFAMKLLLFIWQTGRSLNVKSLIAGQNLMPTKFGMNRNDLTNCSYIALGNSIEECSKYKVKSVDTDKINTQYEALTKAIQSESGLQYSALYCSSVGKPYFGILPPPNYYEWDADSLLAPVTCASEVSMGSSKSTETAETLTAYDLHCAVPQNLIQNGTESTLEPLPSNSFKLFEQRAFLTEKYQNLEYKGYVQLLSELPKKADGAVNKVKSYETIFKVRKSEPRRVYSAFIDWLETNFR